MKQPRKIKREKPSERDPHDPDNWEFRFTVGIRGAVDLAEASRTAVLTASRRFTELGWLWPARFECQFRGVKAHASRGQTAAGYDVVLEYRFDVFSGPLTPAKGVK